MVGGGGGASGNNGSGGGGGGICAATGLVLSMEHIQLLLVVEVQEENHQSTAPTCVTW